MKNMVEKVMQFFLAAVTVDGGTGIYFLSEEIAEQKLFEPQQAFIAF